MAEKLSGATFVIIIASGILIFVLLFIFVKRQIMRFALRSRRGPHIPIGHDANKCFRREIERRIEVIPKIVYEPKLTYDNDPRHVSSTDGKGSTSYYLRRKAVDVIKLLEEEIVKHDKTLGRYPSENLRAYLLNTLSSHITGISQRSIHQFCDLYEHARFDPTEFGEEEYQIYTRLLLKLHDEAKAIKSYNVIQKTSPNKTPIKRNLEKTRNIDVNSKYEKNYVPRTGNDYKATAEKNNETSV